MKTLIINNLSISFIVLEKKILSFTKTIFKDSLVPNMEKKKGRFQILNCRAL